MFFHLTSALVLLHVLSKVKCVDEKGNTSSSPPPNNKYPLQKELKEIAMPNTTSMKTIKMGQGKVTIL